MTNRFAPALLLLIACHRTPAPAPATAPAATAAKDSIQQVNDRFVAAVRRRIAGMETQPAESVFKNIRLPNLKRVPAQTLVTIMDVGYARALGVTCAHCHVTTDFSLDDKRPKRAAREMAVMHFGINQQLLHMENLATQPPEKRYINCMTCHRGSIRPQG
jgi:hypothetical protein